MDVPGESRCDLQPPSAAREDIAGDVGANVGAPKVAAVEEGGDVGTAAQDERQETPPPPVVVRTYRVMRTWPVRRFARAIRFCGVPWFIAVLVFLWPATCVHFLRDHYSSQEEVASSGVCPFAAVPFEAVVAPDGFYPPSVLPNYTAPLSVVEPCTPRFISQLPAHGNGLVCEYGSRASPRFPAFVAYRCSPSGDWWEYPDNCHLVVKGRPVAFFNGSSLWPVTVDAPYAPGPDVAAVAWFRLHETSQNYHTGLRLWSARLAASYLANFESLPLGGTIAHFAAACLPRGALDNPAVVHMALRMRRPALPILASVAQRKWTEAGYEVSMEQLRDAIQYNGTYNKSPMVLSPARILYNALWIMFGVPEAVVKEARPGEFSEGLGEVFESVHTLTALVRSRLIVEHAHACWALTQKN